MNVSYDSNSFSTHTVLFCRDYPFKKSLVVFLFGCQNDAPLKAFISSKAFNCLPNAELCHVFKRVFLLQIILHSKNNLKTFVLCLK